MKKKVISILLTTAMAVSMLTGCGSGRDNASDSGGNNSSAQSESGKDEIVTLKWYMLQSTVAADTDKVIEALNEYTREKIGVEIDYTIMNNADYQEKMPTLINSGEYFDICFTSNWAVDYLSFISKDAFKDITDLLPEYAKETYDLIPEAEWDAVSVNGSIYGVPAYKELGSQSGIIVNNDMATEFGIDLSTVKTLEDYSAVLATVKEKTEGQDVIGIAGSGKDFDLAIPYESLTGSKDLPGASAASEYGYFEGEEEVFNQYATQEYMDYCKMMREWYTNSYTPKDPINYGSDATLRDNDFKNGKLFSYFITYAPGYVDTEEARSGHDVTYIPLYDPLFETSSAMGGLMAISSASDYPEKAMEFINLLNTDIYVGTLIRHGIEGEHYTAVGDDRVDRTLGGTIDPSENGYDYVYGWQFGSVFNQKWDISYPENIVEQFEEFNNSAITAPHVGFSLDTTPVETEIAALTGTYEEYGPALESGMMDPEEVMPQFLDALEANGVEKLLEEIRTQLAAE